jgi:hypothetical protein
MISNILGTLPCKSYSKELVANNCKCFVLQSIKDMVFVFKKTTKTAGPEERGKYRKECLVQQS